MQTHVGNKLIFPSVLIVLALILSESLLGETKAFLFSTVHYFVNSSICVYILDLLSEPLPVSQAVS